MLRERDMVRNYGVGPLMKIAALDSYEADCVWFDNRGFIHCRTYDVDSLVPIDLVAGAKCAWPDTTSVERTRGTVRAIGLIDTFNEKQTPKKSKKSTKPKTSNKIKRGNQS